MPGFTVNIINLITDNLRDRYQSGFPIIKELIQNADDAGADRFVFGDHPGFPNSNHPLLRGPGLFFYNNGGFKVSDNRAIASFAENTKAAEEGTIGKFGLGMKSVFHLCEAFFYVAKGEGYIYREILNPWNAPDQNIHPDWDHVEEVHWDCLKQVASGISEKDEKWFFLWIPLRQEGHLKNEHGDKTGAIIDRFPGDPRNDGTISQDISFLRDESLASKVAVFLPLLSYLSRIEYRSFVSIGLDFKLSLESQGRLGCRVSDPFATGRVVEENRFHLVFHGHKEVAPQGSTCFSLKKHAKWPKTYSRDEMGHLQQTDDKSKPEGSILIASHQNDNANGSLLIQWALFLPLDDDTHLYEATMTKSTQYYRFILHGQFFVEAGRRSIYAFHHLRESIQGEIDDLDEAGLRKLWNQELAQKVVLPMFLPTLNEYVKQNRLDDDEIATLTDAITHATSKDGYNFVNNFDYFLCSKYSWVRLLKETGPIWQLINHCEVRQLLPLPPPPKGDPRRPWKVFPQLGEFDRGTMFVDESAPRISRTLDVWKEESLLKVLEGITPDVFSHSGLLDYLEAFIKSSGKLYHRTEQLQKYLIRLVRNGFRHTSLDLLRKNRQSVSRIIGFIEPCLRLPLGPQDHTAAAAIPEQIFKSLWECNTDILLVPKDLDSSEYPGSAKPSKNDVLSLLQVIHDQLQIHEPPLQEKYLEITGRLLEKLDEADRLYLLQDNKDLTIISAFDARLQKTVPVSFKSLEKARERNNLFGFSQGTTPKQRAGLCLLLSAVIPEEQILLIRSDTFRTLFGNEMIPSASDEKAILRSLGIYNKSLGPEIDRRSLIQHAHNPGQDPIARTGLRYLLHGNKDHFLDDDSLLWVSRHQQSPAWEKLWRQVSRVEGIEAWNVLKREFAECLPQVHWNLLGIMEIEPSQVIEVLKRIGTSHINPEFFTNTECEDILSCVNDKQLWKDLPLHVFQDGRKGDIRDGVYLDIGLALPTELQRAIRVVVKSDHPQVAEKQRKWIPHLNNTEMIKIVLNVPDPGRYWKFIADTLCKISKDDITTIHQLKETAWLPLRNGSFIRPFDVIDLKHMKNEIQILAANTGYRFASEADLDDEIQNHPVMPILKSFCTASGKNALLRLGLMMAELKDYAIGEIELPEEDLLNKMLPTLSQLKVLPAWHVVEKATKEFSLSICIENLITKIRLPISPDNVIKALNALANDAERRIHGAKDAFYLYLKLYVRDHNSATEKLSEIKLRSKTGEWKYADELCYGAANVSDNFILDDDQAIILNSVIVDAGQYDEINHTDTNHGNINDVLRESPNIVKEYFSNWKGFIQEELIGALLCLLGPSYINLANFFLGTHSVEWVIDQIPWKTPLIIDPSGRREWVKNRIPKKVRESLKVAVKIIKEDQVEVRSLTGKKLQVYLSKEFDSIVAGGLNWIDEYFFVLKLRDISPSHHSAEKLSFLIKQTFKYLLNKIYYQQDLDLDGLWQELKKSDQLEIEVARRIIINHLPFYLRQLNAHHHSKELRNALDNYDQALQRLEEFKLSPSRFDPDKERKLNEELDKQRAHLADIFVKNESAQKGVLEALKEKLKDYQYDVQSIPFELFQNADDAVVEIVHYKKDGSIYPFVPEPARKFVMIVKEGVAQFIHWGRMINSRGPLTIEDESRGFQRDLEKMLVLSYSDKPIDGRVTGKFGLGFKSIFLCCNRPCIISGNMRIKITGGILPQLWTEAQDAIKNLEEWTEDRRYRGTLIELQLEENVCSKDLSTRFGELAGLLCVFGKAIRRIIILEESRENSFDWDPEILNNGIEIGSCKLPLNDGGTCDNGVVFRLEDGAIFLALSPTGFVPLSELIPSIWVTSPTRETESFGFAVSAPFSLDAGRGRLSGNTKFNIGLAQKFGKKLGDVLISVKSDLKKNWEDGKRKYRLQDDMTLAGFWATLWRILSKAALSNSETSAGGICREIALKALEKLSYSGIPNGLPYPYGQIVPINLVSYELGGPWRGRKVIEWLGRSGIPIDRCVAADIANVLKKIVAPWSIKSVDFPLLLNKLPESYCTEEDALRLESIAQIIWDELSDRERYDAQKMMAELKFKSKNGEWIDSRFLLSSNLGNREEELRVLFAPDSALLSDTYDEPGRAFFKRCRSRYEAPTEMMVKWIFLADTEAKKQGALRYLLNGELGPKLCRQLREQGLKGTWLEQIQEGHKLIGEWENNEKSELLRLLVENIIIQRSTTTHTTYLDAIKILNEIYSWWSLEGEDWTNKYKRRVYPEGYSECLSNLCRDANVLKSDVRARKNWLILLLLGALHTMGRTISEQHRNFIVTIETEGWLDIFANPDRVPEEWIKVIEEYLDKQVEESHFYEWMKQFVSIFGISRWLEEYVDLFLSINHIHPSFSLDQILKSKASDLFQGGGIEAPPLSRILGIGSCFVIRELTRYEIITNKSAYKYCYLPVRRLRELLKKLGCEGLDIDNCRWEVSSKIYKFLRTCLGEEKAIFGKAFDLPLLTVAENIDLQYRFLGLQLPEGNKETE